jgi:hypothetical protein
VIAPQVECLKLGRADDQRLIFDAKAGIARSLFVKTALPATPAIRLGFTAPRPLSVNFRGGKPTESGEGEGKTRGCSTKKTEDEAALAQENGEWVRST